MKSIQVVETARSLGLWTHTRTDMFFVFEFGPYRTDITMAQPVRQTTPSSSILRRAFDFWPYIFIAISLTGFTYIAFHTLR